MSADLFTWLKALHIMAFAAWMAAMWYLPRLMVYHSDTAPGSEMSATFEVMERRLLKVIGTPAMIATWLFGLGLAFEASAWSDGWFHAKMLLVIGLSGCHGILAAHTRRFAAGERPKPARWYRIINEVPTVLFVGIVVLVVFKPF